MGHADLKYKAKPSYDKPKIAADVVQSGTDTSVSNAYREFTPALFTHNLLCIIYIMNLIYIMPEGCKALLSHCEVQE